LCFEHRHLKAWHTDAACAPGGVHPITQAERQRHVTLAIRRWAFGPFCACCPARPAVVARFARTFGVKLEQHPSLGRGKSCAVGSVSPAWAFGSMGSASRSPRAALRGERFTGRGSRLRSQAVGFKVSASVRFRVSGKEAGRMSNHIAGGASASASAQFAGARRRLLVSLGTASVFGNELACPTRRSSRLPGTWWVSNSCSWPAAA